jgi:uncharacterized RDD family membrane protein YckC
MINISTTPIALLARRLAAMSYDGLLLLAVLLFASAVLIPFAKSGATPTYHPLRTLYLLAVCFGFFGWFWTHGGQTLGMRAWRLQLQSRSGGTVSWQRAGLRFALSLPLWLYTGSVLIVSYAPPHPASSWLSLLLNIPMPLRYGIACLWLIVDHWPDNWRDRLSGSRIVVRAPLTR